MSDKIRLDIIGLSTSQTQSGAYALILGETEGKRRLPIIIGAFEAQAIAFELERLRPNRPLTHDLLRNFAFAFDIQVKEVVINKFIEGVFFAMLICSDGQTTKEIDSRTSDAVALALRFRCPIYCYSSVLDKAGIVMEENDENDNDSVFGNSAQVDEDKGEDDTLMKAYTIEELRDMLNDAITAEDYEKASKIRDEIKKRE
jgi:uncharacterized protein